MKTLYMVLYDGSDDIIKEELSHYTPSEDGITFSALLHDSWRVLGDISTLSKLQIEVDDKDKVTIRFITLDFAEFENIMPSIEREYIIANKANIDTARRLLEENIRKSQEALSKLGQ